MSIRQRRPFTVEIKGNRRKPNRETAGLEKHQAEHGTASVPAEARNGSGSRVAIRIAADILFRRSSTSELASGQSPTVAEVFDEPTAMQAEAAVQPRVLPDLTSRADPIEERLQKEAEERAARRHRPRGPRRKVEAEADREVTKTEHEASAAQEIVRKAAPRLRGRKPGTVLKAEAPRPAVARQSAPAASTEQAQNGDGRGSRRSAARAAWRKARRKGQPMPLRPGERWKRRLSKSAR